MVLPKNIFFFNSRIDTCREGHEWTFVYGKFRRSKLKDKNVKKILDGTILVYQDSLQLPYFTNEKESFNLELTLLIEGD